MEQISLIFISQLGECWLRPRLPSLYVFFLTSLFSCHVLCIVLCTLYIPRPALWFNMHDKFYSCVHTHYPWDWTPAFSSTQMTRKCHAMARQQTSATVVNPRTGEWPSRLPHVTPRRPSRRCWCFSAKHTHTFRFVCFLLNSFILYIGARSSLMAIDRGLVSLSLFLVLVGPQVAYETNAAAAYNGGWGGSCVGPAGGACSLWSLREFSLFCAARIQIRILQVSIFAAATSQVLRSTWYFNVVQRAASEGLHSRQVHLTWCWVMVTSVNVSLLQEARGRLREHRVVFFVFFLYLHLSLGYVLFIKLVS